MADVETSRIIDRARGAGAVDEALDAGFDGWLGGKLAAFERETGLKTRVTPKTAFGASVSVLTTTGIVLGWFQAVYIKNAAFFDAHDAVKTPAIWNVLKRLERE